MITITCIDGANDFNCCGGSTQNDHDFFGLILDDGANEQRLINPIQVSKSTSSVLVFDEHSNYRNVLVSEVSDASTVNELADLLLRCRNRQADAGLYQVGILNPTSEVALSTYIDANPRSSRFRLIVAVDSNATTDAIVNLGTPIAAYSGLEFTITARDSDGGGTAGGNGDYGVKIKGDGIYIDDAFLSSSQEVFTLNTRSLTFYAALDPITDAYAWFSK